MSRILSELFPYMYHTGRNEIIGFVECLEPEFDYIRERYRGLTALVDVNTCPDEYLPYLAALTNCPLIGNDQKLWRQQIKAWPEVLRMKGTERGIIALLENIGMSRIKVDTYWRDANGDYVTEKPDGAPFFHEASGLWRNSRTHYFSLRLSTPSGEILENTDLDKVKSLLPRVKPYHAEILRYDLYRYVRESVEADEAFLAMSETIIPEVYPWPEILYNGVHFYGSAYDPECIKYGMYKNSETFIGGIHNILTDYVFAQHTYGEEGLFYDGSIEYGVSSTEEEVFHEAMELVLAETAEPSELVSITLEVA